MFPSSSASFVAGRADRSHGPVGACGFSPSSLYTLWISIAPTDSSQFVSVLDLSLIAKLHPTGIRTVGGQSETRTPSRVAEPASRRVVREKPSTSIPKTTQEAMKDIRNRCHKGVSTRYFDTFAPCLRFSEFRTDTTDDPEQVQA